MIFDPSETLKSLIMKLKGLIIITATILATSLSGQNEVTVVVPNVKQIKGTMMVCLVKDKTEYLKDCFKGESIKVVGSETVAVFTDVPEGDYAVTLFHDKNSDGKLNTNFIGIPKEPYGFSNNPMALFGPPSYEKCLFKVDGHKRISIEL